MNRGRDGDRNERGLLSSPAGLDVISSLRPRTRPCLILGRTKAIAGVSVRKLKIVVKALGGTAYSHNPGRVRLEFNKSSRFIWKLLNLWQVSDLGSLDVVFLDASLTRH